MVEKIKEDTKIELEALRYFNEINACMARERVDANGSNLYVPNTNFLDPRNF